MAPLLQGELFNLISENNVRVIFLSSEESKIYAGSCFYLKENTPTPGLLKTKGV
jgi:hypothetical protein